MAKRFWTRIIFIAALVGFIASAVTADARQYKMAMSWSFEASHTGYLAAQDKGYFKESGIDIAVERGFGAADTLRRLVTGDIDFGVIDAAILTKTLVTDPQNKIVMVANILQKSPYNIIYVKNRHIKTIADLADAKFAFTGGSVGQLYPTFMNYAMKGTGKPADKYTSIQLDPTLRISALLRGDIDVVGSIAFEVPFVQTVAKKAGLEIGSFYYPDYGFDPYTYGIVVTQKFADADPAAVKAAISGALKGWQWACEHPRDAATLLAPYHTDVPPDTIPEEIAIILKDVGGEDADAHGLGYMNPQRWEETRKLSIVGFKLDEKTVPPATELYNAKFMPSMPIKAKCG